MGLRATTLLTTAPAGSGKSYVRCARFLVDEFLRETDGVHISNFPIGLVPPHHPFPPTFEGETFIDRIAETVAKARKCDPQQIRDRLEIIPDEVLETWRDEKSGPWEYFADQDLTGAHIALDEIHNYCGTKAKRETKGKWSKWLGEIRHRGATVELISQHESKIATEIKHEAGGLIQVVKKDDELDPLFSIHLGDWYELRAKFLTGKYTSCVAQIEKRDEAGKWKVNSIRRWWMTPDYFRFYDSHNAPQSGSGTGTSAPKKEFEKRSALGLIRWFVFRNLPQVFTRALMGGVFSWLILLGGLTTMLKGFVATMGKFTKGKASAVAAVEAPQPVSPLREEIKPTAVKLEATARATGTSSRTMSSGVEAAERQRAAEVLQAAQERTAELERTIKQSFAIGLMTENEIAFRGGYSYAVGQTIDFGPYEGRTIERIDWQRRAAKLDNGTWLRMAVAIDAAPSAPGPGGPRRVQPPARSKEPLPVEAGKPPGSDLR
jgi:hypothetical protein